LLYSGIGVAHFVLRNPFFEITNDPRGAAARGRKLFWWDLAFYAMFGLVVTSSVQIAGVLLVFGLLVIPAVAGLMAAQRPGPALAVGWVFGFVASLAGLLGSIQFDLPAAPSILVALTLLLIVLGAVLTLRGPAEAR
jgi:zinc/manganese transport system permease protein